MVDTPGVGRWLRPAARALALTSLGLVVLNALLVFHNQSVQTSVSQRQQEIDQGVQVNRVEQLLTQTLAQVATAEKDPELIALLARHGIKIAPASAPTPAPTKTAPTKAISPARGGH